jgi:hypothetical protein
MEQKFRVVKYEPFKSTGATTSEALFTTITIPEKILETCKDGFTSEEEAENFRIEMEARNPFSKYKVQDY